MTRGAKKWARRGVGADTTAHIVEGGARGARPIKRAHDEDAIQQAVCLHLTVRAVPGLVWFHVPNGGSRSASEAGRFKSLGVRPGVPDLIALHCGRMFGLELKAPGGRVSPAQSEMLASLKAAGCQTAVAFGLDDALATLERWGLIRANATTFRTVALQREG